MLDNRYGVTVYNKGRKEGIVIGTLIGTILITTITITLGLIYKKKKFGGK